MRPILKVNFFLNFNFRFKKKLKVKRYRFFKKIKKSLFAFKKNKSLRRSMFFYLYNQKSRIFKYWIPLSIRKRLAKKKKKTIKFKRWNKLDRTPRVWKMRKYYKRFWAKNRKNLNSLIKFRAPNQEKQTKYFSQFTNKSPLQIFNMFNHNLFSILFFSNFFCTKKQIDFFIKKKFFYKNGQPIDRYEVVFSFGDRLNVIFTKRYYFYSTFIFNFFKRKLNRLGYFVWKFLRNKFQFKKRQPKNPHKYFEKYVPFLSMYPPFLEIDYKSLTIIWVLPNKNLKAINSFYLKYINYYFFRLYNWKYII